jgi:hypothetical protein
MAEAQGAQTRKAVEEGIPFYIYGRHNLQQKGSGERQEALFLLCP